MSEFAVFTSAMTIKKSYYILLNLIPLVFRWCCSFIYLFKLASNFRIMGVIIRQCNDITSCLLTDSMRSDNVSHFTVLDQNVDHLFLSLINMIRFPFKLIICVSYLSGNIKMFVCTHKKRKYCNKCLLNCILQSILGIYCNSFNFQIRLDS